MSRAIHPSIRARARSAKCLSAPRAFPAFVINDAMLVVTPRPRRDTDRSIDGVKITMTTRRALAFARATTRTRTPTPTRVAVSNRHMATSGETIDSDVRRRDRAAEAVYFHEEDLKNLRVLARKIRAASATQRGSSLAKEELRHLRDVVPETSALPEDALRRLLDWKHA